MPNVATVFKAEISRVARKESRAETESLKKQVAAHRTAIAILRRRLDSLERALKSQSRGSRRAAAETVGEDESGPQIRFSAKGLATHRQRLGISAADMAKLLGVSALSVYKWESGKTRPRDRQLASIAAVRKLGKREVMKQLGKSGD